MQLQKGCMVAETSNETSELDRETSPGLPNCDSVLETSGMNQNKDCEWGDWTQVQAHGLQTPLLSSPSHRIRSYAATSKTFSYGWVGMVSICLGPLLSSALPTKAVAFSCCSSSPSRISQGYHPQFCPPLAYHGHRCKGAGASIHTDATGTVVFVFCYCHQSKTLDSGEVEGDGKQGWRSLETILIPWGHI